MRWGEEEKAVDNTAPLLRHPGILSRYSGLERTPLIFFSPILLQQTKWTRLLISSLGESRRPEGLAVTALVGKF